MTTGYYDIKCVLDSVRRVYGACLGPRLYKTRPGQKSLLQHSHFKDCPVFSFPPWEVIIELALERRACFLSPPLLCGGRSSACGEYKRLCPGGGRDNVVHNPVITTPLLWFAFIKLRRGGFFKVGKLLARQRRLHLPNSLDENGERGCMCVCVCVYVCEGAELNYNLTFLSSGLCSLKERLACLVLFKKHLR